MIKVSYKLRLDQDNEHELIRVTTSAIGITSTSLEEPMGCAEEFEELFQVCEERWGKNWNLEKLKIAVAESEID